MKRRIFVSVVAAALVSACATTLAPPMPVGMGRDDFSLIGRVLIRQADRADVLRMTWQHMAEIDRVRLETSLGQTVAEVRLDPFRAWARLGDGRELLREDDVLLAEELLGTPVPLRRFAGWVRGDTPADASSVERDDNQRLVAMRDASWRLSYTGYGELASAPGRPAQIEARNGDIVVRLRIEAWTGGGGE